MSAYPEALRAHLAGAVTTACHCWRLTRRDATVLGFTDHDRPLSLDGTVFEPDSGLAASEARDTLGMAVDTVDVEGALSSDRIDEADIAAGIYDGATVETFLVNWRRPEDFVLLRTSVIGRITRSDGRFVAELESPMQALDRPNGRHVSRSCDAELGDARCGFALGGSGFGATGTVLGVETAFMMTVDGLGAFSAGWFAHGVLTWTAGDNAGWTERIDEHRKDASGTRLAIRPRGGAPVAVGDAFQVVAGCDKSFATCKAKFGNQLNFRGFPHLPGNDAAYAYVVDGGEFDGGPVVP